MTVRRSGAVVYLEADCPVEEAEALVALLDGGGADTVDVSHSAHIHAALVQVLLRFKPRLQGAPEDSFVRTMLMPALDTHAANAGRHSTGGSQ